MRYLITKARNEEMSFKVFSDLCDLHEFQNQLGKALVIQHNVYFHEEPARLVHYFRHKIDLGFATKLSNTEYEIVIYDDYIE